MPPRPQRSAPAAPPSRADAVPPLVSRPRRWLVGALILLGLALFFLWGDALIPFDLRAAVRYGMLATAGGLSLVSSFRRRFAAGLDRIRHPSRRTVAVVFACATVLSSRYFLYTAEAQNRDLLPKYHDENMYLIQARMLARGRLWMPAHECAESFETFHVFARPVYAPIYFAGTALLYVWAVWLHVEPWLVASLVCGGVVGMCYVVFTGLLDGVAGLLAALLALALPWLHFLAIMVMSHSLLLLQGLLMVWAWQRWRRNSRARWAAAFGLLAGWAAVTRPADALCVALPLGFAFLADLRGRPAGAWYKTATAVGLAAAPFLGLQLVMNVGVTGRLLHTPVALYNETYWPAASFGFHPADPAFRPPTRLPQFQEYYDAFVAPEVAAHTPGRIVPAWLGRRLPMLFRQTTLPWSILLVLVPPGLLALRGGRRWAIWGSLPLFVGVYSFYPFFLEHYGIVVAPAVLLTVLLGAREAGRAWAHRPRLGPFLAAFVPLAVASTALASLHEINPGVHDPVFPDLRLIYVARAFAELPETPAVVLFRYRRGDSYHEESVYNTDVAWPDDADVIRAHDLATEPADERPNARLFAYYARHAPARIFYRYDRSKVRKEMDPLTPLTRLGTATELAKKYAFPATAPTERGR